MKMSGKNRTYYFKISWIILIVHHLLKIVRSRVLKKVVHRTQSYMQLYQLFLLEYIYSTYCAFFVLMSKVLFNISDRLNSVIYRVFH